MPHILAAASTFGGGRAAADGMHLLLLLEVLVRVLQALRLGLPLPLLLLQVRRLAAPAALQRCCPCLPLLSSVCAWYLRGWAHDWQTCGIQCRPCQHWSLVTG